MPKPHRAKLASTWNLLGQTFTDYLADWKGYVKILGIITIPGNLLLLFVTAQNHQNITQSTAPFYFVMNVALVWAMVQKERTGQLPGLVASYYEGSAVLVRYLVVSMLLVIMLAPAAVGAAIYNVAVEAAYFNGSVGPEQLLLGFLTVLFTLPSIFLLVRFMLGLFAVVSYDVRPVMALRMAWRATSGRFWAVFFRQVLLGAGLILLGFPLMITYAIISYLNPAAASVVFNILAGLTILPFWTIFMLKLFRALEHAAAAKE